MSQLKILKYIYQDSLVEVQDLANQQIYVITPDQLVNLCINLNISQGVISGVGDYKHSYSYRYKYPNLYNIEVHHAAMDA